MKLFLHSDKTIKDLNREFSVGYPYLCFRFFKKPHTLGEGSKLCDEVPQCTQLIDIMGVLREEMIEIQPTDTVRQVEQLFQHHIGIPVQIFRKQGVVWIETTATDNLTLEQQNKMGREAAEPMILEDAEHYADWQ